MSAEPDVLTPEQRATLLRVLDWGVESRNMTHATARRDYLAREEASRG